MTTTSNVAAPLSDTPGARTLRHALQSRLTGPGGYYNIGNLVGLATGLWLQLTSVTAAGSSGLDGVLAYFAGSPAAAALSMATAIFLVSGEMYHRAWSGGRLNVNLNRIADLLAALGALALTVSLAYLDQPVLAALTGLLLGGGKLGSAIFGDRPGTISFWPSHWPDLFRSTVLAGRIAGLAAAALGVAQALGAAASLLAITQPAVLVLCHLLWLRADTLLFRGGAAD
ncbi:MAG TPA: hypothetical protein VFE52_03325 [Devosia sp.]|jgi:hypothetical protein|nr:hypothetical protein [Devosia sp.]